MKTKTFKIVSTILMIIFTVCSVSQVALAAEGDTGATGGATGGAADIVNSISPKTDTIQTSDLTGIASKVLGLIQIASAVAAVILIAVFGFKFILGSANEKADYQKSFIPLIVGVVVVFAATSIAKLLFSTFTTTTTNP